MLFSEQEMRGYWPWGYLPAGGYGLIMADPPWRFELFSEKGEEKSAQAHYSTMTLDDIARLPVAGLAAEDCLLWLWATAPMLALQIEILERWGFTFKTSGVWVKTTTNDKIAFGTGYILRNAHEPFLIGTRGNPKTVRNVRSVVMGKVREHSQKPDESYAAAEALIPNVRRIEIFSRTDRPGWDVWGNETGKLNGVAA
jgi:N6-adenosine-specific RNA methylase IME4